MSSYKRRCRRIIKQYGKHIKSFDYRLDNPLDDSNVKKTCHDNNLSYERDIQLSWFAKRTNNITCYNDLVENAK